MSDTHSAFNPSYYPTVPTNFVTESGTAVPSANTLNILGGTGIATAGSGDTVTISLTGSGEVLSINATAPLTANGVSGSPERGAVTLAITSPVSGQYGGTGIANTGLTINLGSATSGYVLTSDSSGNATWQATSASGSITTIDGDAGSATPSGGVVTISGGTTGLTTSGLSHTLSLTGTLKLANGGTNASLTASNGGIFYSTASAGAILSGTSTASQVLLSGASTTPAWSTATYPSTTTANQLLYSSSSNVIGGITVGDNGVLISSAMGVPSWLAAGTTGQVLVATTSNPASWGTLSSIAVTTLTGTANEVLVNGTSGSATSGAITLTTPQAIGTASTPQFGAMGIGTAAVAARGMNIISAITATSGGIYSVVASSTLGASSGTVSRAAAIYANADLSTNSATITTGVGVYIDSGATAGTVTNGYGLYVNNPNYGSNKYCAYFGGLVGIGDTSPGQPLTVTGGGTGGGSSTPTISLNESGTRQWFLGAGYTTTGCLSIQNGSGTLAFFIDGANSNHIGIGGINTPKSGLDVGSAGIAIGSYAGSTAAPSNGLIVSGRIGVGVSSPSTPLHTSASGWNIYCTDGTAIVGIYTGSGQYGLGTETSHNLGLFTGNGGNQVTLTTAGNLGINDGSPGSRLSVVGDAVIGYSSGQTGLGNSLCVEAGIFIGSTVPVSITGGALSSSPPSSSTTSTAFGTSFNLGTNYQNTTGSDILVSFGIGVSTATSFDIFWGVGPSSTPSTDGQIQIPTSSSAQVFGFTAYIPNGYYFYMDSSGLETGFYCYGVSCAI